MPVVMVPFRYSLMLNNILIAKFPSTGGGRGPQPQLPAQPAQGPLLALRQGCHQAREPRGVLGKERPDQLLPLPGQSDLDETPVPGRPLPPDQAASLEI